MWDITKVWTRICSHANSKTSISFLIKQIQKVFTPLDVTLILWDVFLLLLLPWLTGGTVCFWWCVEFDIDVLSDGQNFHFVSQQINFLPLALETYSFNILMDFTKLQKILSAQMLLCPSPDLYLSITFSWIGWNVL